jgi:hypothetical protein
MQLGRLSTIPLLVRRHVAPDVRLVRLIATGDDQRLGVDVCVVDGAPLLAVIGHVRCDHHAPHPPRPCM